MKTLAILSAVLLSSCNLTVDPDGTRNWSFNGAEAAKAIIVYSTK